MWVDLPPSSITVFFTVGAAAAAPDAAHHLERLVAACGEPFVRRRRMLAERDRVVPALLGGLGQHRRRDQGRVIAGGDDRVVNGELNGRSFRKRVPVRPCLSVSTVFHEGLPSSSARLASA